VGSGGCKTLILPGKEQALTLTLTLNPINPNTHLHLRQQLPRAAERGGAGQQDRAVGCLQDWDRRPGALGLSGGCAHGWVARAACVCD